eukprot:11206969-Lingulodinium_polyedra.AAC.1
MAMAAAGDSHGCRCRGAQRCTCFPAGRSRSCRRGRWRPPGWRSIKAAGTGGCQGTTRSKCLFPGRRHCARSHGTPEP